MRGLLGPRADRPHHRRGPPGPGAAARPAAADRVTAPAALNGLAGDDPATALHATAQPLTAADRARSRCDDRQTARSPRGRAGPAHGAGSSPSFRPGPRRRDPTIPAPEDEAVATLLLGIQQLGDQLAAADMYAAARPIAERHNPRLRPGSSVRTLTPPARLAIVTRVVSITSGTEGVCCASARCAGYTSRARTPVRHGHSGGVAGGLLPARRRCRRTRRPGRRGHRRRGCRAHGRWWCHRLPRAGGSSHVRLGDGR